MHRRANAPRPKPEHSDLVAGEWLWTTRAGAEGDLVEEIHALQARAQARSIAPALVASTRLRAGLELAFAHQGFPVSDVLRAEDATLLAGAAAERLARHIGGSPEYLFHGWVPDTDAGNALTPATRTLTDQVAGELSTRRPAARRVTHAEAETLGSIPYLQLCVLDEGRVALGALPSRQALSLAPGGRARTRVGRGKPSRSARKLAEAFAWVGAAPGAGDLCVDLGAAPGGWSFVLLERRARVVAVDPARLSPELLRRKGLRHAKMSAFDFEPDEPADWLFCDMAWRPLEVATLLGRWAKNRWATVLVANFKLPMRKKVEMVLRLRDVLSKSGWQSVRVRQLYHDRDEVTVTAHRPV